MAEPRGFEPVAKSAWDGLSAALTRHFAEERAAKDARDPLQLTRVPTSETRVPTTAGRLMSVAELAARIANADAETIARVIALLEGGD